MSIEFKKTQVLLPMNYPVRPAVSSQASSELFKGLGMQPQEVFRSRDYLVEFDNEAILRDLVPDIRLLEQVDCSGAEEDRILSRYRTN